MVTVLKEKGIFAGVDLFSKRDTIGITDMFKIPLFKSFTLKTREELLDKLEYTVKRCPKGKTTIHQGAIRNALHVLLKGRLDVDVLDISGNTVRVETIRTPRTFATPHISPEKNQFPAVFTIDEDVILLKGSKESIFTLMHSMSLFLHDFLCVSTSYNKYTIIRLKVLSFHGTRNRFIYYLFEHQQKDPSVMELEHTQEQLVEYFGVTRPTLPKGIGRLMDKGFISIIRREVMILNRTALTCML